MSNLPRKFEFVHNSGNSTYIVDVDAGTLVVSPKDPSYLAWKDRVWDDYREEDIQRYVDTGVWIITDDLSIEGNPVEVGDLL